MVSLPVVVTTRDGQRITDLKKEDFQVFEDGVPQEISGFSPTDEPISVALALDTSGSTEQKLARIQNEAIHFVNCFIRTIRWRSCPSPRREPAEDFIDRDRNAYGIKETRPGGWTVPTSRLLALQDVLKPVQERKALVLFTDGVDTASRKASGKRRWNSPRDQSDIYVVYFNTERDMYTRQPGQTVGGIPLPGGPSIIRSGPPIYGPGGPGSTTIEYMAGREYLKKLSEFSGGAVFDALEMDDLGPTFEQIAKELASQYSVGYYSTNTKRDGKFRKVEVKVITKPGMVARSKKAYYAPKG
jgi:Ca-activated chloride channel family protein